MSADPPSSKPGELSAPAPPQPPALPRTPAGPVLSQRCWFCNQNAATDSKWFFDASLYRDPKWTVVREGKTTHYQVNYTPATVPVARCAKCASKHGRTIIFALGGAGVALVGWLMLLFMSPDPDFRNVFSFAWGSVFAIGVGWGCGYFLGRLLFWTGGMNQAKSYPAVTTMLQLGWRYGTPGTRPPNHR